ncbi:tripartite tricarboxylate transporter substrate binding protein [Bradyrhizobium manausense]|uniref:Bug family tripartite tricarboxylate transporter substrate binding protein n=1 Tax=Bradyrhizobium TaxID=374 RepID=UPI001BA9824D|nr:MULTISPECIES: tripartite tricarboxylate transporter substrate binding protein [Bradyrhizobium]MBR0828880.1 tripartite tricarboxylate transporter substrate binding protein [Bradyrhizobium manausense]UVO28111.1 tripartite tricarboxylate transporter substrate binding protein [Bradyrhizobium arachidis]
MISKRTFLQSAACAAATLAADSAFAVGNPAYPSHSVKWVVPYAPGGATDVLSRLLCQRLSDRLGQTFVVENKPGAGGNIGTQAVIASAPDGYTLLLTSTANAINASFDPALPYDFAKGIAPVAGVARIPLVLVVNNDLPVKSVAEFIAYAKANPGKLSIASSGIGTSLHLSGELFKAMAGVQFTHVPYRGSAPGLTDVMSGQVQGMFDNVTSSFELVRAGKLRALGVTTRERSDILPDVPAIADTLVGFETSSFYGVGAPHDTPPEIVGLLNREIDTALSDPEIRQRITDLGAIALHGNAAQFGGMLTEETARWRKVVELSGVRKE